MLTGSTSRPSVLEPHVRYDDGLWHMWYLSTPHEAGPGDLPDHRLEYVASRDGLTRWSTPRVVFTVNQSIFDNSVLRVGDGYEMVVARGHNLYADPRFPPQGLWWLRSARLSGDRLDWTADPVKLLDPAVAPDSWYRHGTFGPSLAYGDTDDDRDTMYVFFTGVRGDVDWLRAAVQRLRSRRRPPVPAPFYFSVGVMARRGPRGQ